MPRARLSVRPDAAAELDQAVEHCAARSVRAAEALLRTLEETISWVRHHPRGMPRIGPGLHKALLGRFPYLLVYRIRDAAVEIIAVAHAKRRPGYCRRRLRG